MPRSTRHFTFPLAHLLWIKPDRLLGWRSNIPWNRPFSLAALVGECSEPACAVPQEKQQFSERFERVLRNDDRPGNGGDTALQALRHAVHARSV